MSLFPYYFGKDSKRTRSARSVKPLENEFVQSHKRLNFVTHTFSVITVEHLFSRVYFFRVFVKINIRAVLIFARLHNILLIKYSKNDFRGI